MDEFEEAICGHNPLYKEGLQDKYYQGAKWAWQSRQAEFDSMTEALLNQAKLLAKQKVEIDEKDKRIETALALIDTTSYSEIQRRMPDFIDQLKQVLRGTSD